MNYSNFIIDDNSEENKIFILCNALESSSFVALEATNGVANDIKSGKSKTAVRKAKRGLDEANNLIRSKEPEKMRKGTKIIIAVSAILIVALIAFIVFKRKAKKNEIAKNESSPASAPAPKKEDMSVKECKELLNKAKEFKATAKERNVKIDELLKAGKNEEAQALAKKTCDEAQVLLDKANVQLGDIKVSLDKQEMTLNELYEETENASAKFDKFMSEGQGHIVIG